MRRKLGNQDDGRWRTTKFASSEKKPHTLISCKRRRRRKRPQAKSQATQQPKNISRPKVKQVGAAKRGRTICLPPFSSSLGYGMEWGEGGKVAEFSTIFLPPFFPSPVYVEFWHLNFCRGKGTKSYNKLLDRSLGRKIPRMPKEITIERGKSQ